MLGTRRTGRAGRKGICTLIVPQHRRGAAARVLKLAKLEATTVAAPTGADIEARNRQRILEDPALSETPNEEEMAFVRELMAAHGAEQIAAAYLRRELAARPAPEELADAPIPTAKGERSHNKFERDERPSERFENGVWFRVSVGRKHRAEPRWLLPMICKAGHITKREVGAIKILEAESHVEIVTEKADAFAAAIKKSGATEKGVTIQRIDGTPPEESTRGGWNVTNKGKFKPNRKPRPDALGGKPHKKSTKAKRPKPLIS